MFHKINVCVSIKTIAEKDELSVLPNIFIASDTNEIAVSKSKDELSKSFSFDKIVNESSVQDDFYHLYGQRITGDVIDGFNHMLFLCRPFDDQSPHSKVMTTSLIAQMLNGLWTTSSNQLNSQTSLHCAFMEVREDEVIDVLGGRKKLELFDLPNPFQSVKDLCEVAITDKNDIDCIVENEITPSSRRFDCFSCSHRLFYVTFVSISKSPNGFECMRNSRFTLVDMGSCLQLLMQENSDETKFHDSLNRDCLLNLLKPSLLGSRATVILSIPSVLRNFERDLHLIETVSNARNFQLEPVRSEKLIYREALLDYAEEIKASERELNCIKKNIGVEISLKKYWAIINKEILVNEELKELRKENEAISWSINNKKEILRQTQADVALKKSLIEGVKANFTSKNNDLQEMEIKKTSLELKRMKQLDEYFALKETVVSHAIADKNEKARLAKFRKKYEEILSDFSKLEMDISNIKENFPLEVDKLRSEMDFMLIFFKEAIHSSAEQIKRFTKEVSDMYEKFELTANIWSQTSSPFIENFLKMLEEGIQNGILLKENTSSQLLPLDAIQDDLVNLLTIKKDEIIRVNVSFTEKMKLAVDSSLKYLSDIQSSTNMFKGKLKEQLQAFESSVASHAGEQVKFLSNISNFATSIQQQLMDQVQRSVEMKTNITQHHSNLKTVVDAEFQKITKALHSLKELFNERTKYSLNAWDEKYSEFLEMKNGIEDSNNKLNVCLSEKAKYIEKINVHCVSNITELQSNIDDQIKMMMFIRDQLQEKFKGMNSNLETCALENVKQNLELKKDVQTATNEGKDSISQCIQNAQIGFDVLDLNVEKFESQWSEEKNKILNSSEGNELSSLKDFMTDITNMDHLMKKEICHRSFESDEDTTSDSIDSSCLVFNHSDLLCSTPSSHLKRPLKPLNEKSTFIAKLKEVASKSLIEDSSQMMTSDRNIDKTASQRSTLLENKADSNTKKSFLRRKKK